MNTDAVICIALTSTNPSRTSLSRRHSSIWGVMLINATRVGVLNQSSLRKFFNVEPSRDAVESIEPPPYSLPLSPQHSLLSTESALRHALCALPNHPRGPLLAVALSPEFLETPITTTGIAVDGILDRVFLVIVLMIILRGVELRRGGNLGHNRL